MKLAANVPPNGEGKHRVVREAFEVADLPELLADTKLGEPIQSLNS